MNAPFSPDSESTPTQKSRGRGRRRGLPWWGVALIAVPVLLIVLLVSAWVGVTSFLRGEAFRSLMTRETNKAFKADGQYGAFDWNGSTVYSPGYNATGADDGYFKKLESTSIRAEMDLDGIKRGFWTVKQLEVGTLDLELSGSGLSTASADAPQNLEMEPTPDTETPEVPTYGDSTQSSSPAAAAAVTPPSPSEPVPDSLEAAAAKTTSPVKPKSKGFWDGWLPDDFELKTVLVKKGSVAWAPQPGQEGRLAGTRMELTPMEPADLEKGWRVQGSEGTFTQAGLPKFTVGDYRIRASKDEVFVESATLTGPQESTLHVDGSIRLEPEVKADIKATLTGYPLKEVLRGDWQKRFEGRLSGDVHLTGAPTSNTAVAQGTLFVENGVLQGFPVLDQIAKYTKTDRFLRLQLDQARTDFKRKGERTEITNLVMESKGLLKLTGGCIIKPNQLKGEFRVGVTSASLRWLPGAEKRVFTESADGYLWATMKVNGPVESPREDLTPRLVQAAGDEIVSEANEFLNKTKETADEGTKQAIDAGLQILNSLLR